MISEQNGLGPYFVNVNAQKVVNKTHVNKTEAGLSLKYIQ